MLKAYYLKASLNLNFSFLHTEHTALFSGYLNAFLLNFYTTFSEQSLVLHFGKPCCLTSFVCFSPWIGSKQLMFCEIQIFSKIRAFCFKLLFISTVLAYYVLVSFLCDHIFKRGYLKLPTWLECFYSSHIILKCHLQKCAHP